MENVELRNSLQQLLGSNAEPVAVTFCDTPPTGVERVASAGPAGCSYWKLAAEGACFFTSAEDHLNCPIGAYIHGAQLTAERQAQLEGMIHKMVGIPILEDGGGRENSQTPRALRFVKYAPLSKAQDVPEVVLLRGNARQMMLVVEAANARRLMSALPIMGRPACAVIAASVRSGEAVSSLGCMGNRVYTQLPDDEFYVAVPGRVLNELVEALGPIVSANSELEKYHSSRCGCA